MTIVERVYKELEKLDKEQSLKVIELVYNEKGVKEMLSYYLVGALELDDNSPDTKADCTGHLKVIKEAKALVNKKYKAISKDWK